MVFFYEKGSLSYTEAAIGDDPLNYLFTAVRYTNNNDSVTIFENSAAIEDKRWLSGYIKGDTLHLSGENITFKLIKYHLGN